ncbi:hypothetical protein UK23_02760 [Lentzea aerocolonigenes]|uniref:Uncharacterized protein n=1 Tax=Lentzea aerocolonigenes TaxID=68170 RepID=A0A0F0HDF4_LENAE|nr:hypothetical protein [Lentzea aerocolonigenes]KJK52891.1 hypothetical protein UK23_02760 [Lentzea aerocolonigenes]
MKHVAGCFVELAAMLVLVAIGFGGWLLLKWGWSESPTITVVAVVAALGFMGFGVAAWTGKWELGTVGKVAGVTAGVALLAALALVSYGQPLLGP